MAKKLKKDTDIHHSKMVKTIFIVVSIAIVCFLVVIVKYTSFKSEPRAAGRISVLTTSKLAQFERQLKQRANYQDAQSKCVSKFSSKGYFSNYFSGSYDSSKIYPKIGLNLTSSCLPGSSYFATAWDPKLVSADRWLSWNKQLFPDDWRIFTKCCVYDSYFSELGDKYCSSHNYNVVSGTINPNARYMVLNVNNKPTNTILLDLQCKKTCPAGKNQVYEYYDPITKTTGKNLSCDWSPNPFVFTKGKCCTK